jgi:hypothetical protein
VSDKEVKLPQIAINLWKMIEPEEAGRAGGHLQSGDTNVQPRYTVGNPYEYVVKTLLALCCLGMLVGCGPSLVYDRRGLIVVSPSGAPLFGIAEGDAVGDSIGHIPYGDTLRSWKSLTYPLSERVAYRVEYGGKDGYVIPPYVVNEWELHPTTFISPYSSPTWDREMWLRAAWYVRRYATVPLQEETAYRIETQPARHSSDISFLITRTARLQPGDTVRYTVTSNNPEAAAAAAYFIEEGEDPADTRVPIAIP